MKVGHFYAAEKNGSNYNLLRMNLLMHGVPYKKFSCFNSDSIKTDNYYENGEPLMFDIQVENFKHAYNVMPDLLAPRMEIGVKVANWETIRPTTVELMQE